MKTLPEVFASRGDPWVTEREQDGLGEGNPDMDRWTDASRQRKRSPLLSRYKAPVPTSRADSNRLPAAKLLRAVRVKISHPRTTERYRVSWFDGRYHEVFWSLGQAQHKAETLQRFIEGANPVVTVEECH